MKKIFELCSRYIVPYNKLVVIYISLCILLSFKTLAMPYITGNFIDYLVGDSNVANIVSYCIIFTLFTISGLIFGFISNRLYIKLQTTIAYDMNKSFLTHMQKIPLSFYKGQDTATLNQRINSDSNTVVSFCISLFQNIFANLITIFLGIIVVASFDVTIAGIIALFPPCYYFAYQKCKRLLFVRGFELKESQAEYFGKLYEQISYVKQIKLFSLFSSFPNRLGNAFGKTMKSAFRYQEATYAFSTLDTIISLVAQIFFFFYCGAQVIAGQMSIGNFTIISSYFSMMMAATKFFFSLGKSVQDTKISCDRLLELETIPNEQVGNVILKHINSIEVSALSLLENHKAILADINAHFQSGRIYTIEGPNGAGKSSLINVIAGLYGSKFEGDVIFDGLSMSTVDMYYIRNKKMSIAEQNPTLFQDTVRYNIVLDSKEYDEEKFQQLVHVLGLQDFFESLPNGIDMPLGENAATISGGEKQKISLLRALMKDFDILLLDEPTSALDAKSIHDLMNYLTSIKLGKIIIIVTHDQAVSHLADETIYLKEGHRVVDNTYEIDGSCD